MTHQVGQRLINAYPEKWLLVRNVAVESRLELPSVSSEQKDGE
jgi:hypothetical protein